MASLIKEHQTETMLELAFAAHSGGYRGMFESLRQWQEDGAPKLDWHLSSLVMLDNFYSTKKEDLVILEETLSHEVSCLGFTTGHNQTRWQQFYKPLGCKAQGPQGYDHILSVKKCLPSYLAGANCHP